MTTFVSTGPANVTTNAHIQALATVVAQAFTAIGLIKTADTGQMNTTTITYPGTAYTSAGYEIRRFDDPLQASYPIYIRWEPYRSASSGTPAIRFRFGSGTDGAGNLANEWGAFNYPSSVYVSMDAGISVVGGSRPVWASGSQSASEARASLIYVPDSASDLSSVGIHMAIQRSVDINGVPTGDGFFAYVGSYNPLIGTLTSYDISDENFFGFSSPSGWRGSWSNWNIGSGQGDHAGNIGIVPFTGIGVVNGVHYPTPWTALGRSRLYPPLPDWLLYHKYIFPIAGTNFTAKRNGVNRTFRATGQALRNGLSNRITSSTSNQQSFDWRLAVIWE